MLLIRRVSDVECRALSCNIGHGTMLERIPQASGEGRRRVAVGSDRGAPIPVPAWFFSPGHLDEIAAELGRPGWSEAESAGFLGGNAMEFQAKRLFFCILVRVRRKSGDLSIIIVAWNSSRVLPACLESIDTHLSGYVTEVLVVDNDSRDSDYLEKYRDHPKVRVIRNPSNLGFAKANNIAIAQARGSHLLILNPDVRFEHNPIPSLLDALEAEPGLAMVSPLLCGEDGLPQVDGYYMSFPTLLQFVLIRSLLAWLPGVASLGMSMFRARIPERGLAYVDQIPGAFMLFRRDLPVDRPVLDERFFIWMEDVDLCYRLARMGRKVGVVADERVIHTGGASFRLVGADRNRLRFLTSYHTYLRKHRGWAMLKLELAVMALDSMATFAALVAANVLRGRPARALQAARSEAGILRLTLANLIGSGKGPASRSPRP